MHQGHTRTTSTHAFQLSIEELSSFTTNTHNIDKDFEVTINRINKDFRVRMQEKHFKSALPTLLTMLPIFYDRRRARRRQRLGLRSWTDDIDETIINLNIIVSAEGGKLSVIERARTIVVEHRGLQILAQHRRRLFGVGTDFTVFACRWGRRSRLTLVFG